MIPISRGGAAGQRKRNGISRDNEHEERRKRERESYEEKVGGEEDEGWKGGWPRKCERRIESFCIVSRAKAT